MHAVFRKNLINRSIRCLRSQIILSKTMATNVQDGSNGALEEKFEQVVTMENVVAADNTGIDYDKLISKIYQTQMSMLLFLLLHGITTSNF